MKNITLIRVATLIVLALVWEAIGRSGLVYNGVVPPLSAILASAGHELLTQRFYEHLAITLFEIIVGFAIGSGFGIVTGLAFGIRRYVGRAAAPYVAALATTPKIVFLPIVMLAAGIGVASKVTLGALSAFFPVAIAIATGVRGVRPVLIRVGHAFNLSTPQMVFKIYLPALMLPLVTGLRLGLGVTVIGVLLGEIKLAKAGLGFLASDYYNQFRIPELYGIIVLIFILAALANSAMGLLERRYRAA
jgi:ABC-type nitrate/sulfonate/bicarbonate transport system permease component